LERLIEMFRRLAFPQWSHMGGSEVCGQADFWQGTVGQFSEAVGELLRWSVRATSDSTDEPPAIDGDQTPPNAADSVIEIQARLLERLPLLAERLQRDVQAACLGDPACLGPHEVVVCYPGFTAVLVHRLAHELYQLQCRLAARVLAEWAHGTTGIDIHPGATIGDSFFIDHGTGVVIGETCVVGNHVKIYQGVTLGALSFTHDASGKVIREAKRHPTIEDHVVIYAGATVLGGGTVVGHHSVIG
jgi:serine O-acetyltransferase